jgi:Zn-dependent protease
VLGWINLIPIPPLDGSRIVTGLLPNKLAYQYNRFERFGFLFLLFLLWSGGLGYLLGYPMFVVQKLFFTLAGL